MHSEVRVSVPTERGPGRPRRVLVVEDSLTIRRYIVDILSSSEEFEVIGEAGDGKTAIELCRRYAPDVVTMDMMLPVMTGVAATEYIMAHFPTAILIVSSSMNRGEQFRTYDALAAGAVDVLEKPDGREPDSDWEQRLVRAVRLVSRIRVIRHPRAALGRLGVVGGVETPLDSSRSLLGDVKVVAVGASTGGPSAVLTILRSLPVTFRTPILLVLHIAEPFGQAMADWLDAQVSFPVRYARHGEALPSGCCVIMAPPGKHLEYHARSLRLTEGPERHSCRPSVDVLFESLAADLGTATVACLLTGMGKDGAAGLLRLREAGAQTIAQDEETSVVFGMPGEAVRLGAAQQVLPLSGIASALGRLTMSPRKEDTAWRS